LEIVPSDARTATWTQGLPVILSRFPQPFIDENHELRRLFPDKDLAVTIPVTAGVLLLSVVTAVIGIIMITGNDQQSTETNT
jgi:hypothetical protein